MNNKDVYRLHRVELVKGIKFEHTMLWDYLIQLGVITTQDVASIKGKSKCDADEVRELLAYMEGKFEDEYLMLREALKKTKQSYIVDKWLPKDGSSDGATGGITDTSSRIDSAIKIIREEVVRQSMRSRKKTIKMTTNALQNLAAPAELSGSETNEGNPEDIEIQLEALQKKVEIMSESTRVQKEELVAVKQEQAELKGNSVEIMSESTRVQKEELVAVKQELAELKGNSNDQQDTEQNVSFSVPDSTNCSH